MAQINVLPKHLASLIAAGEVVERPASVIKELLENSIDAGAGKITVEIKNGGVRYMRITDDGCGILREDVKNAFISHATSKIKEADDLDSIMTLGFRGEALPSVASVSHTEVLTKTADESVGTRFLISGEESGDPEDAGCPVGTTMIVRDLFYNTPARMKFLKKDTTEGNYVSDAVAKIALSHPEIGFTLIKDNRRTLFTPGDGRLTTVINEVYGREFGGGLIECSGETNGISVKGYISKPVFGRPNRTMQHCFVNGRYVKIPVVASSLDNAYKNQIMTGKYPACVLFLTMNPRAVDVNVHPAKTQVRFARDKDVYDAVYFAAVAALREKDRPEELKLERAVGKAALFAPRTEINQTGMQEMQKPRENPAEKIKISFAAEKTEEINSVPPVENMYKGIKKEPERAPQSFSRRQYVRQQEAFDWKTENGGDENADAVLNMRTEKPAEITPEKTKAEDGASAESPDTADINTKKAEEPFRIIGEAFGTYIIAEQKGKLLFVDKHAAHERIIFNSLKKRENKVYSQILMSPVIVTLAKKDYAAALENLEIFSKSGFAVEDFGEGTLRVRECPTSLADGDIREIILEMADQLANNSKNPESEKLDWLYHSTACRAAVKAGDNISVPEMEKLVETVLTDAEVRYCPHGRPTLFTVTEYDIKKLFGRLG